MMSRVWHYGPARLPDARGETLAPLPSVAPGAGGDALPPSAAHVTVNPGIAFQTHLGMGGAFTESAALNWQALSEGARDRVLRAYFAPPADGGHGYNLGRVPIGGCDFALDPYAHVDGQADPSLRTFSIERDRRHIIPLIRAAQAISVEPLRLVASPWSPPAWMKTNGHRLHGGALREDCRDAWALYFVKFIQAYEDEGIPIWAVTPQNEPRARQVWDSCLYTPAESLCFIRDHLAPALQAHGLSHVKIIGWDHNRDLLVDAADTLYGDPVARGQVWGLGYHWYGPEQHDNLRCVREAWPDKHLLFTEGCQEGGPHLGDWNLSQRYLRAILADFGQGTEGWIDWNLFLDLQGGPNHAGNFCSAPIHIDAATDSWLLQSSYHAIGLVSRFVRPGDQRVLCASSDPDIQAVAYHRTGGATAVVLCNRSSRVREVRVHAGTPRHGLKLDALGHAALCIGIP